MSLHDLLQLETLNESFAETIERESAGGYDLSAAHEKLGYYDSPITRRKGVYQDAKDAVEAWREAQNEAKGLEEERSRLTKLQRESEESREARAEKEALEQAITYRNAKLEYEIAKDEVEAYPEVLEPVTGDEVDRVEDLDDQIEEWETEKQTAREKQKEGNAMLDTVTLPEDGVSDGVIERLKKRREELKECESNEKTL